jgi:formate/nitrite transporter FocA (FNT family)
VVYEAIRKEGQEELARSTSALAWSGVAEACRWVLALAQGLLQQSALVNLLRGVFAGWLIALMVWLLPVARGSRVAVTSSSRTWWGWAS